MYVSNLWSSAELHFCFLLARAAVHQELVQALYVTDREEGTAAIRAEFISAPLEWVFLNESFLISSETPFSYQQQ